MAVRPAKMRREAHVTLATPRAIRRSVGRERTTDEERPIARVGRRDPTPATTRSLAIADRVSRHAVAHRVERVPNDPES
jgi:hypothetical protein